MPSGTVSRAVRNAVLAATLLVASRGAGAADLPSRYSDGEFPPAAARIDSTPRSPCPDARLNRKSGRVPRARRRPQKANRRAADAAVFENPAVERLETAGVLTADDESRLR